MQNKNLMSVHALSKTSGTIKNPERSQVMRSGPRDQIKDLNTLPLYDRSNKIKILIIDIIKCLKFIILQTHS
jgi:hypothetical protein